MPRRKRGRGLKSKRPADAAPRRWGNLLVTPATFAFLTNLGKGSSRRTRSTLRRGTKRHKHSNIGVEARRVDSGT